MNKLRKVSTISAYLAIIFMVVQRVFNIEIPEFWIGLEPYILAILISLGIATDSAKDPTAISKESILEKLKSPMAMVSIVALIGYVMYAYMPAVKVDKILEVVDYAFMAFLGFNVWQSPNVRNALR